MSTFLVFAHETPDGWRVSADPPDPRLLSEWCRYYESPAPVPLPAGPLSAAEFEAWERSFPSPRGGRTGRPDLAYDEWANRVPGVQLSVLVLRDDAGLAVLVSNPGPAFAANVAVTWEVTFEKPRPVAGASEAENVRSVAEVGDGFRLLGPADLTDLGFREHALFRLPPEKVRDVLSNAASLEPARYGLAVSAGGEVVKNVLGREFVHVLMELEAAAGR